MELKRDFYTRDTLIVSRELIGKRITFNILGNIFSGIINETEGYTANDEACHAFKGKTIRTMPMFAIGGTIYVYFIYGMYYCMNIVTEEEGIAGAALVRGIKFDIPYSHIIHGPGKLCKFIGIDKTHNYLDVCSSDVIKVYDANINPDIMCTKRIGITKNVDPLWRFVMR